MAFRPPVGRSQYYCEDRGSRLSVYICCSDLEDDRAFAEELKHCLESESVDVFFDEGDYDLRRTMDAVSHSVLIVTPALLRHDVDSVVTDTILRLSHEDRIVPLLLLVDVELKDFEDVFPFYASNPLRCEVRRDVLEAADKISNLIMPKTENRTWAGLLSSSVRLSVSRQRGLRQKPLNLIGRKKDVKRILDFFYRDEPSLPLCCISGLPGIGKTSLATYVAHQVREMYWKVIYVDAQHLESETDFCTKLLMNLKPRLLENEQSADVAGPLLSEVIQLLGELDRIVIIFDGCDRALATKDLKHGFWVFLRKILESVKKRFMILMTSRQKAQFSDLPILEVALDCLENDEADNLLKSFISREFQCSLKQSTIASIRELCFGVPLFVRLAGALLSKYRDVLTQEEVVEKMREKPFENDNPATASKAFILSVYNLIPSSMKLYLHGLALFSGSFTRMEGAQLFGLGDEVQFAFAVIGPLREFSLLSSDTAATGDQIEYRLHNLVREFLNEQEFKAKEFRNIQERYCVMQLSKISEVQTLYDKNPRQAILLFQMCGFSNVIRELTRVFGEVGETSLAVWKRLVSLASCPNSSMRYCLDKDIRKDFLSACLGVASKRNLSVIETDVNLCLAEVLLEANDFEEAASNLRKVHTKLSSLHAAREAKDILEARYCLTEAKHLIGKNEGQNAAASLLNGLTRYSWAREQPDYYATLGSACNCNQDYNEAVYYYRKALELLKVKLKRSQSPHPDISDLLFNTGSYQFCSAHYFDSYQSFLEALEMQRYLRSSRFTLATTSYHLGICQASLGKFTQAFHHFKEVYALLGDTKIDQSAVNLLARQAHAKVLYTRGVELWKTDKSRGILSLREAAFYLHDHLLLLMNNTEMLLIFAESHALLLAIYSMLSDKKQAVYHQHQLCQLSLDEGQPSCSILSYIRKTDIEDNLGHIEAVSRLSVIFYCYIGGRLLAASEDSFGKKQTRSNVRDKFVGQRQRRQFFSSLGDTSSRDDRHKEWQPM
ncbi:uncharacterized protein [Oscarella lobularis]|uniref:uncharacterized protein n=1 Tax=Oscarella lobularis TaxID=121494 RepID=UPI003313ABF0